MSWVNGNQWSCDLCDQIVKGEGPWCRLYAKYPDKLCRPIVKRMLNDADALGDGPFVNALCQYGRDRWGADMDW